MYIFFYITLLLLFAYGFLIKYYKRAWDEIPYFNLPGADNWKTICKVTVIIPARNEEKNIAPCQQSLRHQTYPREYLEIIVVNDHSTDNTESIVKNYAAGNIKLINLRDHVSQKQGYAYKKKAIEIAIGASTGELIVTTDADCVAKPDWIKCLSAFHTYKGASCIAAPVRIIDRSTLLSVFESLDFISLQGITGASIHRKIHSMANGANLSYDKNAFYAVEGFKDIDKIPSGDDMLLIHKIYKKFPDRIFFLKSKNAIVSTQPAANWREFFRQRIRWASKASDYDDKRIFRVLLLVYLLNVSIFIFLAGSLWNPYWLFLFFILVTGKTILEFSFVKSVSRFFNQRHLMKYFFFLQPLHIIYTVITGWLGKFGSYQWKDRKIK
ncbi:MAG TPA: glycosyltransferase [Puia sp.]|nr:glycosyltransferase [Puia sp.]